MSYDTFDFDPRKLALTPAEAAEALGVSKSHVYRMLHSGELHGSQLGRRWCVSAVGLMRLLDVPCPSGVAGNRAVEPSASLP